MGSLQAHEARPDRGFERIYRRHVGDVYRYALAVMRNQPDAEDVTQTTFLNAYRAFERGERPQKAQNWLIAIAHNVCRQRFRQSARRPTEVAFDDDIGSRLVEPDDETPTGEDIRRALGHLAFNQRAALVMRELEGRSYAEIAEILELSPSAVETLIFRARRALREQLESSLTCGEAELAISRQLDGRLGRREKGALRAHLRECPECATFARRQRAQRAALRSLAAVPVPSSLTALFGGGGAAIGTGLVVKAATVLSIGALVGAAGYEGVNRTVGQHHAPPVSEHRPAPSGNGPQDASLTPVVGGAASETPVRAGRPTLSHRAHPAHSAHPAAAARRAHPAHPVHPFHPVHPARVRAVHRNRPTTPRSLPVPPGQAKPHFRNRPIHD